MQLQIEDGVNRDIAPNFAYVEMGGFKVSGGRPLYTYGAGPCMNVVVHNEDSNFGGLAHVAVGPEFGDADLRQPQLFEKASKVVTKIFETSNQGWKDLDRVTEGTEKTLLEQTKSSTFSNSFQAILSLFNNTQTGPTRGSHLSIWLGAGGAFCKNSEGMKELANVDFADHLKETIGRLGANVTLIDERKVSGGDAVVYDPFNARVYRMKDDDLDFIRHSAANAPAIRRERTERLTKALGEHFS